MSKFNEYFVENKVKFISGLNLSLHSYKKIDDIEPYEWYEKILKFNFNLDVECVYNVFYEYDINKARGEIHQVHRLEALYGQCLISEYDQSKSFDENLKKYIDGGI